MKVFQKLKFRFNYISPEHHPRPFCHIKIFNINNIYKKQELSPKASVKEYLIVRKEGSREVKKPLNYYNLDMIISVGYRIKSYVAARFRIWATERLKEYIVKGFYAFSELINTAEGKEVF
jgi:hypothetical protein